MDHDPRSVRDLFLQIVDLPLSERAAAVDRECGNDLELRGRIEALLKAHDEPGSALAMPDAEPEATVDSGMHRSPGEPGGWTRDGSQADSSPTTEAPRDAQPGIDIAGRYRLLEKIGEGGMGEVWVAKQTSPVKRKVALKLIKIGMDSRTVLSRFEQERQALAMMDHPNIARVLDAGMTSTGQPFFVMELVNGLPLAKYCDEARLTPKERLELFVPICQAIQHAHQKGIVHRDLKPANILVTLVDGKPVPKVIDFGVAKATGGKLTDETLSTGFGAVVGTLEYMSPEQAGFSNTDIDTRADIYSLGVILYEMLTGLRPIDAGRLKKAAFAEMIRIIQEEEPSRPSTRLSTDASLPSLAALRQTDPRKLMSLMRGELDWVVMKCLEKSRDRRYETVNALSRDIQRYLKDEPVEARPPSARYRMGKFLKRNKATVVAASLVLTALVVGLTLASYGLVRARAERDRADKARIEAQAQRGIADNARIDAQAQKQLAVGNAKEARVSAREAKVELAQGFISQADALSRAGRFADAHQLYISAYDKLAELKEPLFAAETGLWSSYHQASFPLLSFTGHTDMVLCVAISPDGRTALSGSRDKTLKLWELASGKELRTFTGHTDAVFGVAISPDGRTALSGSFDKTLKLWDLASGKELRTFTGHTDKVAGVAISPDGRTALSGSADKTLKLWDLATGKELRTLTGYASGNVAISPDGRTALSGSFDRTLKLWDVASGKDLRTFFTGYTVPVWSVAVAPDGRTALSCSQDDKTPKLWDLASGKELRTLTGHEGFVSCVAIAADGRTALSGSFDQTLKLWDLASGKNLRTFAGHTARVSSVAISPDGRTALSGSWDTTLKLWDLVSEMECRTSTGHSDGVRSVAIAPDGRTALSGSFDKTLKLWDMVSGMELRTFTGHTRPVHSVGVSPDGRTALSGSDDHTLKLWDLASGKELRTFRGHDGGVNSVAIAADGKTALSGSSDRTLKLWDLTSGKALRTFKGHTDLVTSVALTQDARMALSGSWDKTLKLWDLASGKELRTFEGHTAKVWGVAITPDGRTALSCGDDRSLMLWDLATGKVLHTFTGHTFWVSSVAIAPDGRTALSGCGDDTLKLWDLASGKELRTFTGHTNRVWSVAIAPDGRAALSGSLDKTLKFWDFTRGVKQRAFEPRVTAAQARLRTAPNDPVAMATLGDWYAFRRMDQWAVDYLVRPREGGAAVAPLMLARCYWNLGRLAEARREFRIALEQSTDASERTYLSWCISAVDSEPERDRLREARAAIEKLKEQADQKFAAGHTQEGLARLLIASVGDPDDMEMSVTVAVLQAWFGQDAEVAATFRRAADHADRTTDASVAYDAAEIGLLLPTDDNARLEASLALARRAVELGKGDPDGPWYQMTVGIAEYRTGRYPAADEALIAAERSAKDDPDVLGTSAFFRAMSLFRQGKETEARALFAEAASKMKPLPADEANPMDGGAVPDNLVLWMAYKEAKALLKVDAAPATRPKE